MRRAVPALLGLALAACASAQPPPATPVQVQAPRPPAAPVCQSASLPADGISACMPGEPEPVRWVLDGRRVRALRSAPAGTREVYLAARVARVERDGPALLDAITASWQRVDARRPFERDGFAGEAIEGMLDGQRQVVARALVVGEEVYLAQVEGPAGALDPDRAEGFFESFEVDVPWRIHASAEGRYTVAVPAPASRTALTKTIGGVAVPVSVFVLGGAASRAYFLASSELPSADPALVEQSIEAGISALADRQDGAILKLRSADTDGVVGREVLFRDSKNVLLRMRIFVTEGRMYITALAANRIEGTDDEGARRFFESFQITGP
ncbi:MAG: hypothetical protein IT372_33485 [Polyangiaceae bacterium]|nr:hypothetical protein [Polyangiaceae bacterium]